MNLIEAIRSGLPFRLKSTENWIYPHEMARADKIVFELSHAEWISDEWEIEEQRLPLTWSEIRQAYLYCGTLDKAKNILGFKEDQK